MRLLYKAGIPVKMKKFKLLAKTVYYFGHAIWPGSPDLAEGMMDCVAKLHSHTKQKESHSFLRLSIFFKQLEPNFANLTASLNKTFRKTT